MKNEQQRIDKERQRIEEVYERRAHDPAISRLYTVFNPTYLHMLQSREREVLALLRRKGIDNLHNTRLLDVGSGYGIELSRWISHGCQPENCTGIDLLHERIEAARRTLPTGVKIQQGDATSMPYASNSFDIVCQYTLFATILDNTIRKKIAAEMLRVLAPGGLIIWYDFWWPRKRHHVRGISLGETKRYFPNCRYDCRALTLHPKLSYRVTPRSWLLASLLEKMHLCSHWLVGITPK